VDIISADITVADLKAAVSTVADSLAVAGLKAAASSGAVLWAVESLMDSLAAVTGLPVVVEVTAAAVTGNNPNSKLKPCMG
jgi:cysteine synthase